MKMNFKRYGKIYSKVILLVDFAVGCLEDGCRGCLGDKLICNVSNFLKEKVFIVCICCCSVAQLCLTLWDPMNYSTAGFLVHHYFLEFAQTRVH